MSDLLCAAAREGDTATVLRLLSANVSTSPDQDGWTTLHYAAAYGHTHTVAALMSTHGDAHLNTDVDGFTPLQRAAAEGHEEVVKLLIEHHINIDLLDRLHGNTPLHEASWKGFSRTVQILCRAHANSELRNSGGFTPLHLCCQNGHNQTCRELLLAGSSPDIENNYGDTPLHTSARYGHAGVMRILISGLCNVSHPNKNGDTALHIAVAMGRRKLTRILLEAGSDQRLQNKQKETARDIAVRKKFDAVLRILDNPPAIQIPEQLSKLDQTPKLDIKLHSKTSKKRAKAESGTSSKESSTKVKEKKQKGYSKVHFDKPFNGPKKNWSPYGCHYYPDLREFPSPNLDSLPKEPLQKGEQYYLDLAGNIRKGPVGIGTTCYCGPLLCNVTRQMKNDKKELLGHIDGARAWLDKRLSAVEERTTTQIKALDETVKEQLAVERARCKDRTEISEIRQSEAMQHHMEKIQQWLQKAQVQGHKSLIQSRDSASQNDNYKGLCVSDRPSTSSDLAHSKSPDAKEENDSYDENHSRHSFDVSDNEDGDNQQWQDYQLQRLQQYLNTDNTKQSGEGRLFMSEWEHLHVQCNDSSPYSWKKSLDTSHDECIVDSGISSPPDRDFRRQNVYLPADDGSSPWLEAVYQKAKVLQNEDISYAARAGRSKVSQQF